MENKFALDRRTFVAGSAVAAATLGLGMYGCGGGSEEAPADGEGAAVEGGAADWRMRLHQHQLQPHW